MKNKKLKILNQNVRRQEKKIKSMKAIILELDKNLIDDDASGILLDSFSKHQDLITNWAKKNLGQKLPRKYSLQIRQFSLSLHFFSAKAYTYVRHQFNTILTHPRTLSKWYSHLNAAPGFTLEAL